MVKKKKEKWNGIWKDKVKYYIFAPVMSCRHYRYSVNTILERGLYINPCNCCNQLRGFLFFSKQHDTIGVSLAVDIGLYHT